MLVGYVREYFITCLCSRPPSPPLSRTDEVKVRPLDLPSFERRTRPDCTFLVVATAAAAAALPLVAVAVSTPPGSVPNRWHLLTLFVPQVVEGLRQKAMDERLRAMDGLDRRVRQDLRVVQSMIACEYIAVLFRLIEMCYSRYRVYIGFQGGRAASFCGIKNIVEGSFPSFGLWCFPA